MRHRPSTPVRVTLLATLASTLLAGCAEMHHGVEAVGRIGPSAAPTAEAEAAPPSRPDVRTVRPRGTPRVAASEGSAAASQAAPASAVPSPHEIFDFHPAGSRPDGWRQPFVIDAGDGPLAADVRRSAAELKAFLADAKAGAARTAGTGVTGRPAPDGVGPRAGLARKVCGEMDVAAARPGCGVPRAPAAAAPL